MKKLKRPELLPSGRWRIRYTDESGKRRSETFESEETAAFHRKKREIEVEEIKSGLRLPRVKNKSFEELCSYWLENRTSRKRSAKDDQSIIRCHLLPAFGKMKLSDIGVVEIDEFRAQKSHLSRKTVSNILTLFISIMNLAKEQRCIAEIPRITKPKISKLSKNFRYLKTEDEIDKFLNAARTEGEIVHGLYAVAIYTGLREGELAALTFDKIDLEKRLIKVDRSFNGPTKSNETRFVPILNPIYSFLLEWKVKNDLPWVFPNQKGNMQHPSARIFQEVLHRVLEKAAFPMVKIEGKEKRYICFHDLRHTFASHWMMSGGDVFRLKEILGHADVSMTMRYSHLSPHVYESDYGRFGKDVMIKDAKVLQMRQ